MPEKKQKKGGPGPQKKPKKKKMGGLWTVIGVALLVVFSGAVYLSWQKPAAKRVVEGEKPPKPEVPVVAPAPVPERKERPRIAIIIDDLGNSKRVDDEVLSIDAPLSLSVFPLKQYSMNVAQKAGSNGKEVMLHLPMEPHDYPRTDPGEGALLTSMDDIAIITQLYEDIKSVPSVKGVNNHMGSKFTEDGERMRIVLRQLKDRGLFFIDSKTSPKSQSDKIARSLGLKAAARDVFLDNEQNEEHVLAQIEELKRIARIHGSAIGIGHPYPVTIAMLKKVVPSMGKEFELVPASELVR